MTTRSPTSDSAGSSPDPTAAAIDRFCASAPGWRTTRVLDEGLDLARDTAWADHAVLISIDGARIREVARRPTRVPVGLDPTGSLDPGWFPWGLAPINPRRFLLVGDAGGLPVAPGSASVLGDLGIRSCLHLPVLERQRPVGALQLAWCSPHDEWDDRLGRLLRILGRSLLSRATDPVDGADHRPDAAT